MYGAAWQKLLSIKIVELELFGNELDGFGNVVWFSVSGET